MCYQGTCWVDNDNSTSSDDSTPTVSQITTYNNARLSQIRNVRTHERFTLLNVIFWYFAEWRPSPPSKPVSVLLFLFCMQFFLLYDFCNRMLQQINILLQYIHLIPAPVDRTSANDWLKKHAWITCQKQKPSTSTTHVVCE